MKKAGLLLVVFFMFLMLLVGCPNPTSSEPDPRPVIMLTGFWSPSGEMLRHFSQSTTLNPDGWAGSNWENEGYDVISYFPDPDNSYTGDFEQDYQNVSDDFWKYVELHNPVVIMSFGTGDGPFLIEYNARNLSDWVPDSVAPTSPTPTPPDASVPTGYIRTSTLPVDKIASAVNSLGLPGIGSTGAWVDSVGNPGRFVNEYIAYLGMWHQEISSTDLTKSCLMAGFISISSAVPVASGREATEESIRVIIEELNL